MWASSWKQGRMQGQNIFTSAAKNVTMSTFCPTVDARSGLIQWLSGKESTCSAGDEGDSGSIPGSGRSPREGHSNPPQCSCWENPIDRGDWQAAGYSPWGHKELTWLKLHGTHPQGCRQKEVTTYRSIRVHSDTHLETDYAVVWSVSSRSFKVQLS